MRSAVLHMAGDALASLAVILAAAVLLVVPSAPGSTRSPRWWWRPSSSCKRSVCSAGSLPCSSSRPPAISTSSGYRRRCRRCPAVGAGARPPCLEPDERDPPPLGPPGADRPSRPRRGTGRGRPGQGSDRIGTYLDRRTAPSSSNARRATTTRRPVPHGGGPACARASPPSSLRRSGATRPRVTERPQPLQLLGATLTAGPGSPVAEPCRTTPTEPVCGRPCGTPRYLGPDRTTTLVTYGPTVPPGPDPRRALWLPSGLLPICWRDFGFPMNSMVKPAECPGQERAGKSLAFPPDFPRSVPNPVRQMSTVRPQATTSRAGADRG